MRADTGDISIGVKLVVGCFANGPLMFQFQFWFTILGWDEDTGES